MKILLLTHYFPPEVNAPATRSYEHAVRWAREGHDVTVLTCVPNCPDGVVFGGYRNRLRRQIETMDGVRVVRVWTYLAPNSGTARRIANYLSYLVSAVLAAVRLPRPDVVVATSPQFFCGWAGVWISRLKWRPFVLEIRDIWPESIGAVGAIRRRWLLRFLEWLERRMYRAANHIVTVGNGYRKRILQRLAPPAVKGRPPVVSRVAGENESWMITGHGLRIHHGEHRALSIERWRSRTRARPLHNSVRKQVSVITNGVDLEQFVPVADDRNFRRQWGLEGKFVCCYVGTIGMAHGLEVVLEAARLLGESGRDGVRFLLVGDGAERARLERRARELGVDRQVVFTGRLPKDEMPRVLAASDACLVHLRGCELFESVIPSKLFEIMAMRRPIIMGVRGEACEMVLDAGAGLEMEPDSASSLVSCIETLADTPGLVEQFGLTAREYVALNFSRDVLAARYLDLLESIAETRAVAAPAVRERPVPEPIRQ